ncbi:MAG: sugar phosphate isomerase/epimerase [Planctomycetes bacterium]|nr:sugar phosphate isomerase/epimerase [Planctomycetota bacterium]
MSQPSRRSFLRFTLGSCAALAASPLRDLLAEAAGKPGSKMRIGLVTYLWGQDWDLPTVIRNCERSGVLGVELRTEHKHGVEPSIGEAERREVKKRFADSPVVFVGPGSNERFDHPDPKKLEAAIEATKGFIKLSHDCGGSGVKVKPDSFHEGVPREKTIEQIGKSLDIVGKFAADHGQEIRLEVHGQCSPLPIMKQIMDHVTAPNVGLCWNSNGEDLKGEGLEHNFNLVKKRFGKTVHVRELEDKGYPYQKLMDLLVAMSYEGWILLECRGKPADRVQALIEQREIFETMVAAAQAKLKTA